GRGRSMSRPAGSVRQAPDVQDVSARPRLSVILITLNEAHGLERCLRSVDFADEIVVVDSGSTDDTVALARAAGARVAVQADWPGFGRQKNRALDLATGDWVLSIDARRGRHARPAGCHPGGRPRAGPRRRLPDPAPLVLRREAAAVR